MYVHGFMRKESTTDELKPVYIKSLLKTILSPHQIPPLLTKRSDSNYGFKMNKPRLGNNLPQDVSPERDAETERCRQNP